MEDEYIITLRYIDFSTKIADYNPTLLSEHELPRTNANLGHKIMLKLNFVSTSIVKDSWLNPCINEGLFTSWTMKLSHVKGHFSMVIFRGHSSMVRFMRNAF
jgi:hypothetical protein